MSRSDLSQLAEKLFAENLKSKEIPLPVLSRTPVHVVYGGAHLYKVETPHKLGALALKAFDSYSTGFVEFAKALWLKGADTLPQFDDVVGDLESSLLENPSNMKAENFNAWFAWSVYDRVAQKLRNEPIEDFRIDFEDGYGFRPDEEEDSHALSASEELAKAFLNKTITPFCGFRIKSFAPETFRRATRTLDIFLSNLIEKTGGKVPDNFVVTLPKISRVEEVNVLAELLTEFENTNSIPANSIGIEIMIETPQAIINEKGEVALRPLVSAANGRCTSAHFGAYDFTSSFGIVAEHQYLRHDACNFARQIMQISLAPLGIRLSDSVTTELPVSVHRGENLDKKQISENTFAIHKAWRLHFNNVTNSLINGFYQSWDLHPAQLIPRYAAIYAFFLESADSSAKRLKGFIEKATQAMLTGNQFDDAASAQGLLNFFIRAKNCGALSDDEIMSLTGLRIEEIMSGSFQKIIEKRKKAMP